MRVVLESSLVAGIEKPLASPAAVLDGGNLDCGSGLLLLIRKQIDPLVAGQILEIRSTEPSVAEDLPAWCRMTGHPLVRSAHPEYLIQRKEN